MILLDILKVKKKNHPGNQNAVGKEYIRNTGLVFRLGGAIVSFFFFLSCDRSNRTFQKNSQVVS